MRKRRFIITIEELAEASEPESTAPDVTHQEPAPLSIREEGWFSWQSARKRRERERELAARKKEEAGGESTG